MVAILNTSGQTVVTYSYDAWGNILSIGGSMANTLGKLNPLRYRGYIYDQETGLYYLQSRYYDPQIGRFINADAFTSTGQDLLGNNMFAYCLNNPVNLVDPSGSIPFSDGFFDDTYRRIGEWIGNMLKEAFDKERRVAQKLTYISNGEKNGAEIIDSYTVNNPIVMYEYIEKNRGDEIAGSNTGVVFEWIIHNIAYRAGEGLSYIGFTDLGNQFKEKGGTLDIGRTIYDDQHDFVSLIMWACYASVSPATATYDLCIKVFE